MQLKKKIDLKTKRIIPCLDMSEGRVVKGIKFVNIKDAGDPIEAAIAYNNAGADEIALLNISATIDNRSIMIDVVNRIADSISIPIIVGGGISSINDISDILKAGAVKVSINSSAFRNPDFISEAVQRFGSECIVVAIDVKRIPGTTATGWEVIINGGREATGKDALEWATEAQRLGAGEILLTSMDCDGMKNGYDIKLTKAVSDNITIPVIASGGAGKYEHFKEVLTTGGASAVLAASLFHYNEIGIRELKNWLKEQGINVNL